MFSPSLQFFMFMVMVALGLTLAFLFDVFRAVRAVAAGKTRLAGHWFTDLLDLLFWLIAVPAILLTLGLGSWGQLRTFTVLGLGTGILLYAALGSPTLLPAMISGLTALTRATLRAARFARRATLWLARRVRRAASATGRATGRIARLLLWPLAWLLGPLWRPLAGPWRQWQERARRSVREFLVRLAGARPPEEPPGSSGDGDTAPAAGAGAAPASGGSKREGQGGGLLALMRALLGRGGAGGS